MRKRIRERLVQWWTMSFLEDSGRPILARRIIRRCYFKDLKLFTFQFLQLRLTKNIRFKIRLTNSTNLINCKVVMLGGVQNVSKRPILIKRCIFTRPTRSWYYASRGLLIIRSPILWLTSPSNSTSVMLYKQPEGTIMEIMTRNKWESARIWK